MVCVHRPRIFQSRCFNQLPLQCVSLASLTHMRAQPQISLIKWKALFLIVDKRWFVNIAEKFSNDNRALQTWKKMKLSSPCLKSDLFLLCPFTGPGSDVHYFFLSGVTIQCTLLSEVIIIVLGGLRIQIRPKNRCRAKNSHWWKLNMKYGEIQCTVYFVSFICFSQTKTYSTHPSLGEKQRSSYGAQSWLIRLIEGMLADREKFWATFDLANWATRPSQQTAVPGPTCQDTKNAFPVAGLPLIELHTVHLGVWSHFPAWHWVGLMMSNCLGYFIPMYCPSFGLFLGKPFYTFLFVRVAWQPSRAPAWWKKCSYFMSVL